MRSSQFDGHDHVGLRDQTMFHRISENLPDEVTADDLENQLRQIRTAAAGPIEGIFGPNSIIWRVDREAATFLGAGRALLLQLAHPWVSKAIEQHSNTFADPIARFHRTFSAVFTMVFGSLEQSLAVARHLHRRHALITGMIPPCAPDTDSIYYANSLSALRWVHATLTDTALVAYELVCPALADHERERYLVESRLFAGLVGIPRSSLPENWDGFSAYLEAMTQSGGLCVTDSARAMAHRLLSGANIWFPIPNSYRALTSGLLPPRLRSAFGLKFDEAERELVKRLLSRVRLSYPLLPAWLRYVGPYQEAQHRISNGTSSKLVTQLSNRFWIGRPSMPAPTRGHSD
jgi:uncharacterized protein (DUF2236 family)